jgi:ABC-type molybdate transport system substrate-binding protein
MSSNFLKTKQNRVIASVAIAVSALGLAYVPIPGLQQTIVIASGTELQAPLEQLKAKFEQDNPNIKLDLRFQGSQDIANNFVNQKGDFKPTVLIPASAEFLQDINQRSLGQMPFAETPQAIAKTMLVGIAWPERGKVLFPDGRFSWQRLEQAMQTGQWSAIGGQKEWGSFDFVTTDPTRSNSGQVTMNLWAISKQGNPQVDFNAPSIAGLFGTVKRAVYQPPRSTDVLLQEFITRGTNDADVATVYESVALSRWQQSTKNQGKPYQIYYLNPTIETVATAAIASQDPGTVNAAKKFVEFLRQPDAQKVFVQYGFRSVRSDLPLQDVPNSPWTQNIPGVEVNPSLQTLSAPNSQTLGEIQRVWQRAN